MIYITVLIHLIASYICINYGTCKFYYNVVIQFLLNFRYFHTRTRFSYNYNRTSLTGCILLVLMPTRELYCFFGIDFEYFTNILLPNVRPCRRSRQISTHRHFVVLIYRVQFLIFGIYTEDPLHLEEIHYN